MPRPMVMRLCSGQGSASSPDVWYLYTATRTGRLKLDASDANFAALLSLHQPTCPGSLDSQVACGYPILTFSVQQGATYLVRVAGIGNASGSFNLKVGYDTVVIKHEGQNQPLSEGWTRDVNPGQSFTEGAATDTLPFWYLAQIDTLRLNYQYTGLAPSDFSDPQGWTMTAIAKAVTAPTQWQGAPPPAGRSGYVDDPPDRRDEHHSTWRVRHRPDAGDADQDQRSGPDGGLPSVPDRL